MSCLDQNGPEFITIDDIFIKQMLLAEAGDTVEQHAHCYAHTTLVAAGSIRVWRGGELMGDFAAPSRVFIPAKTKHTIMALEDKTLAYCIHNVSRSEGKVEIHEKAELPDRNTLGEVD
jgi:mannose-6-phosphate isomerase-like protein (cupin superfamily)